MVFRDGARLYEKSEDNTTIYTYLYKSGKIKTYWKKRNIDKDRDRRERGRKILKELKINGCAICGYNKCDRVLDFHHTNPKDKKFYIHATEMSRPLLTLAEELNKCILLCKNCHYEIHDKEQRYDK